MAGRITADSVEKTAVTTLDRVQHEGLADAARMVAAAVLRHLSEGDATPARLWELANELDGDAGFEEWSDEGDD